jgi:hypothetical protein
VDWIVPDAFLCFGPENKKVTRGIMRTLIAVALATTLVSSTVLAAGVGPLAPGKPAGVKQAQLSSTSWVLIGVGVVAAVAVGVASSSNGSPVGQSSPLAVTTTTV